MLACFEVLRLKPDKEKIWSMVSEGLPLTLKRPVTPVLGRVRRWIMAGPPLSLFMFMPLDIVEVFRV